MFTLGCDDFIYSDQEKLSGRKAEHMSASTDGLWIVDAASRLPYKFNPTHSEFEKKGKIEASQISVGLKNNVLITGKDRILYRWGDQYE